MASTVSNPLETPHRFDILASGDFVVFDFKGELFPTEARAVFVAAGVLGRRKSPKDC